MLPSGARCIRDGDCVAICSERTSGFLYCSGVVDARLLLMRPQSSVPNAFEKCTFSLRKAQTWTSVGRPKSEEDNEPFVFGSSAQLRHVATDRLVCVSRIRGEHGKPSFAVELTDNAEDPGTMFRVMPRYKIRQEGEKILEGDHVVFLNEQCKVFLYLDASQSRIVGSVSPDTFSFKLYRAVTDTSDTVLFNGRSILLFHKEQESFLTFRNRQPSFLHPTIRDSTYNIAKLDFSTNSFWMIESRNPTEGCAVRPSPDVCRLKHVASGLYLSVDHASMQLRLTSDVIDLNVIGDIEGGGDTTLWEIIVSDTSSKLIESTSTFFRIKNTATGLWLHADSKEDESEPAEERTSTMDGNTSFRFTPASSLGSSCSKELDELDDSLYDLDCAAQGQSCASSGKECETGVSLREKSLYVDVFCACCVSVDLERRLRVVIGHRDLLKKYAAVVGGQPRSAADVASLTEECRSTIRSLEKLIPFCSISEILDPHLREGKPNVVNQRMLLDQQLHVAVFDALVAPCCPKGSLRVDEAFLKGINSFPQLAELYSLGFHFLRLLVKRNLAGCQELRQRLRQVQDFFLYVPNSCALFGEVIMMIAAPVSAIRPVVEIAVNNLREHERFFELLRCVCLSQGRPNPTAQLVVTECLEECGLPQMRAVDVVSVKLHPGGDEWEISKLNGRDAEYMCGALKVLAATVAARPNAPSWINLSQLVFCLEASPSPELSVAILRAASSLVSSHGASRQRERKGLWQWENACESSLLPMEGIAAMKKTALVILDSLVSSQQVFRGSIDIVTAALSFLNNVALHGFVEPNEMRALVDSVEKVLFLVPKPSACKEVAKWSESSAKLMECVHHCCHLMHTLVDSVCYSSALKLRALFREAYGKGIDEAETSKILAFVRSSCTDPDIHRVSWMPVLFDLSSYDDEDVPNNALSLIFQILCPMQGIQRHINVPLVFSTTELGRLYNIYQIVRRLQSQTATLSVVSPQQQPTNQFSDSIPHVGELLRELHGVSDELVLKDAQNIMFVMNTANSLLRMMECYSQSASESHFSAVGDIVDVLEHYFRDNLRNAQVVLKGFYILAHCASARILSSTNILSVLTKLFRMKTNLDVCPTLIVAELVSSVSTARMEALTFLLALVSSATPCVQESTIEQIYSSFSSFSDVFKLEFDNERLSTFIDLLSRCCRVRGCGDHVEEVVPLGGLLHMAIAARETSLSMVEALLNIHFNDDKSPPEVSADEIVLMRDQLLPRIERSLRKAEKLDVHVDNLLLLCARLLGVAGDDRVSFIPVVARIVSTFLEKFAKIVWSEPQRAEGCAAFLQCAQKFILPAVIPDLPSVVASLKGTAVEPTAAPTSDVPPPLDTRELRVLQWHDIQEAITREVETPTAEQLVPLTTAISSTDASATTLLDTMVRHLQNSRLDNWVTVDLLLALEYILADAMEKSETALVSLQDRLNALNATPLVSILLERQVYSIVKHVVRFGIALMQGGNKKCQDSLLDYFASHDEKYFYTMRQFLKTAQQEVIVRKASSGTLPTIQASDSTMIALSKDLCRFLQLLCEGHHFEFQNYVRHQHDNFNSYNMCTLIMELLHTLVKRLDSSSIETAIQILNTLTEFCQGPCPLNQACIVSSNVMAEVNRILSMAYDASMDCELVMQLKCAAIITLLSLLEGSQNAIIPNLILDTIDIKALHVLLDYVWAKKEDDDDLLDLGFNIHILGSILISEGDRSKAEKLRQTLRESEGHEYFSAMMCNIEIWRDDDPKSLRLESVYFRRPDISNLREETKENVLTTVNRSSLVSKHSDFFRMADNLIFEMEYQSAIEEYASSLPWYLLAVFSCRPRMFEDLLLVLSLISNALLISGFQSRTAAVSWSAALYFFVLGVLQFLVSVYLVAVHFILKMPLLAHQRRTGRRGEEDAFLTLSMSERIAHVTKGHIVWAVCTENYTIFFAFLAVASFFGIFRSPYFYSFSLLLVTFKAPLLGNIVKAISMNGRQLLLTAFLGVMMVYFFSVVGFLFFSAHFTREDATPDSAVQSNCDTLVQCFFFSFGKGLRGGGGIGEELKENTWGSIDYYWREAYDTLFWVVIAVVVMNIIFALIVDTFAELRDARKRMEEDMNTTCFICGIDAATFDREGEGFHAHTKGSHNMWQYLYFMHHLRRKDKCEFTGQESYVYTKMLKVDLSFFPVNRSKSLKADEVVEDDDRSDGTPGLQEIRKLIEETMSNQWHEYSKQQEIRSPRGLVRLPSNVKDKLVDGIHGAQPDSLVPLLQEVSQIRKTILANTELLRHSNPPT